MVEPFLGCCEIAQWWRPAHRQKNGARSGSTHPSADEGAAGRGGQALRPRPRSAVLPLEKAKDGRTGSSGRRFVRAKVRVIRRPADAASRAATTSCVARPARPDLPAGTVYRGVGSTFNACPWEALGGPSAHLWSRPPRCSFRVPLPLCGLGRPPSAHLAVLLSGGYDLRYLAREAREAPDARRRGRSLLRRWDEQTLVVAHSSHPQI